MAHELLNIVQSLRIEYSSNATPNGMKSDIRSNQDASCDTLVLRSSMPALSDEAMSISESDVDALLLM